MVLCLWITPLAEGTIAKGDAQRQALQATGWIVVKLGQGRLGLGTGFVIDKQKRLVMTNRHVVGDKQDVEVFFPAYKDGKLLTSSGDYWHGRAGKRIPGKVLASDVLRDLAIVQLDSLPEGIRALRLADRSAAKGDLVMSIGNAPEKPDLKIDNRTLWTCREGKVTGKAFLRLDLDNNTLRIEASQVLSSLGIQKGDSGGPVINTRGELVGVNSNAGGNTSRSIDITEVRIFLARFRGELGENPRSLAGAWKLTWDTPKGQQLLSLTLHANGKFLFEGARALQGTYKYQNGRLVLTHANNSREVIELTYVRDNEYRARRGTTNAVLVRR
jgi:hypothetical protein